MKKIFNKSKKPTCSHDNFFKVFFSEPKLAKELLQLAFSKSELRYFDLNNIKTEKDTYEEKRADLILSIPFQDKSRENLKLLIILEHKSFNDKGFYERQLDYLILFRKLSFKQWGVIQPTVSLLFYHGQKPVQWKNFLQEEDFKGFYSKLPLFLKKDMLNYGLRVINTKDPKIRKLFKSRVSKIWGIVRLLDEIWSIRKPSSRKVKTIIKDYFREILRGKTEKEVNEIIVDIVEYLRDTTGLSLKNWRETEKQLIEEGILKKGGVMLIKDVIKEKGRWEGIRKGIRKGRQERDKEVILNMLKEKMNISVIAKVTGLSEKEIKKFKNGA